MKFIKLFFLSLILAIGASAQNPRSGEFVWSPTVFGNYTAVYSTTTFTPIRQIFIDRFELTLTGSPVACTTNAVVAIIDQSNSGATLTSLTMANGTQAYDTGATPLNISVPANHILRIRITTAAAGCSTSPGNGEATIQYH